MTAVSMLTGQSGGSDIFQHGERTSFNPDASQDMAPLADSSEDETETGEEVRYIAHK